MISARNYQQTLLIQSSLNTTSQKNYQCIFLINYSKQYSTISLLNVHLNSNAIQYFLIKVAKKRHFSNHSNSSQNYLYGFYISYVIGKFSVNCVVMLVYRIFLFIKECLMMAEQILICNFYKNINIGNFIIMEEFVVPIQKENGHTLHIQIKPKYSTVKSRKVRTWTTQEDQQLMNLYEKFPKKWAAIANHMYDRNENQCLHRYRRLSQLGAHKKIWSSEEDQTIKKMIKKVGKNWKVLSEILGTKTGKQIRERYINKLDPRINKEEWTIQEDKKLLQLYCTFGSKWSEISKQLPGRPQNKIKNRFYSYIKKNYDLKEKIVNPQLSEVFNPSNLMNSYKSAHKPSIYQSHAKLPSIQDFDLQNKQVLEVKEIRPMDKENYIRSMIKLQEDWGLKRQSIGDIVSQNDIVLDRDLLYLSHY